MTNPNLQVPVMIQTQRGNIPIDNLNIGDTVYSYESGAELEIHGLTKHDLDVYKVEYNDGRISYYTRNELEHIKQLHIHQYHIDYSQKKVTTPLYPDPYIAGALCIYGDETDLNLNLPSDSLAVNNLFAHKYQLNYGGTVSAEGKVYFRYNGKPNDELITWVDFFSNYIFAGRPENYANPPIVPLEYSRSSISDRLKFIRGVFDVGYSKDLFPNNCGIAHTSREKLVEVQKVLWSLGILSIITYDATTPCALAIDKISTDVQTLTENGGNVNVNIAFKIPSSYKAKDYRLYVLGKNSTHPGYFYNVDSIENMIDNSYKNNKYLKFQFQVKSVELYTKTSVTNVILHKAHLGYLTDNFLPKISGKK